MIPSLDTRCPAYRVNPLQLASEMINADPVYRAVLRKAAMSLTGWDFLNFIRSYVNKGGNIKALGMSRAEDAMKELGL